MTENRQYWKMIAKTGPQRRVSKMVSKGEKGERNRLFYQLF